MDSSAHNLRSTAQTSRAGARSPLTAGGRAQSESGNAQHKVELKKREVEEKGKLSDEKADRMRRQRLEEYNRLHIEVQARKKRFEGPQQEQSGSGRATR